jgi:hypothetical protein
MMDALRADNLAAAQQAYQRLQSDLTLDPTTLANDTAANTGNLPTGEPTATSTPTKGANSTSDNGLNAIA